MSERPSQNLGGLDPELARQIDAVCRRFEADWREGCRPRMEEYLVDVSHEGRSALRAELEALERELRPSEETVARPESGPPHGCRAPDGTESFHDRRGADHRPWTATRDPYPVRGAFLGP